MTKGRCVYLKMCETQGSVPFQELQQFNVQLLNSGSFLDKSSFYKILKPCKGFPFLIPVSSMVFL